MHLRIYFYQSSQKIISTNTQKQHTELTLQDVITHINTHVTDAKTSIIRQVTTMIDAKIDAKIDEFAIMVGKQFNAIDDQFKEVHQEFKHVHNRLDTLEGKIDQVSQVKDTHSRYFKGFRTILQQL